MFAESSLLTPYYWYLCISFFDEFDRGKKNFFSNGGDGVKVKWRVVNARDGSGVAIRPDRVKDRAAVVMRVWETVRCRTDRMVGLTMCLWF